MIANVLSASGPYGLVAILAWAFWRKNGEIKDLYSSIVKLTEVQTAAITRMEAALESLTRTIELKIGVKR